MNWSALDWGVVGPALVAGLLVLATHVPLGMQVLDRGIVFIDLAIAQIAGLGVIAADALGIAVVKLPFTVGGSDAAKDLFGLFDDTVARLLAGVAKP